MQEQLFNKNGYIIFNEEEHTYTDIKGRSYISVSKCLEVVRPEFKKEQILEGMATKALGQAASPMQREQYKKYLNDEWLAKNKLSIDYGHAVHALIEEWDQKFTISNDLSDKIINLNPEVDTKKIEELLLSLDRFFKPYAQRYNEQIVWSEKYMVAGTMDKPVMRTSKGKILDIFDYKTNIAKGIQYDSIRRTEDGKWDRHYNKFFNSPFQNVEYCNYWEYSLQLSIYARLAEEFNQTVGRLGIIFIDKPFKAHFIPVPYLRLQAEELLHKVRFEVYSGENIITTDILVDDDNW